MVSDCVVAFVATSDLAEAKKIAEKVVEEKLAACVNIIPTVHSVYRWQGAIESATESKLIIKTTRQMVGSLTETIRRLHSYDVCEVTVLPIISGNVDYLNWVRENVG
jgi:periplasmic divalent cation tolerance protein